MESMKMKNQLTAYELMEKAKSRKAMSSYNAYKQMFEGASWELGGPVKHAFIFKKD